MNNKEKTSLLVSSLAISGGVVSSILLGDPTGTTALVVKEGLSAFGGLGQNLASNGLQNHLIDRTPQEDILKNGDLTRAIGNAIFKLCGQLAEDTTNKNDKESLRKLSETDIEIWENLVLGGEYEEGYGLSLKDIDLTEVSSEKSVQYFNAQADTLDEITALTPQSWQSIIRTLCNKNRCSLSRSATEEISNKLHLEFGRALRKTLIADFEKDGKAYASMQFRLLSEILFYTKDSVEQNDSILPIVIDLSKKIDEINQKAPKHYSPENTKEWKVIFDDFESFRKILEKTHQNTEETLTIVKQILENQSNELPKTSQKYFPANFPQPTRFFTGRGDVLEKIKEALDETNRACLHDISGIGKTQSVLQYAEIADYDFIFYLKPESVNYLDDIWESADFLGFQLSKEANPDEKVNEFRHWLATHEKWLVIFDDVTDVKQIKEFINTLNGHFLFTSNLREAENLGKRVMISKFKKPDSQTLLYRRGTNNGTAEFENATGSEKKAINRIVREFDGLPLALNICGSFIADGQMSFDEFSHDIFEHQDDWDDYSFIVDGIEYKSFGKVFELTFHKLLKVENEDEKDTSQDNQNKAEAIEFLFKAVSFLSPNEIPQDILSETLKRADEKYARFAKDDNVWLAFRPNLTKYDLLQFDPKTKTFETHRLIQKAIEKQFRDGEKSQFAEVLTEVLVDFYPGEIHKIWDGWGKYIPHAQSFLKISGELKLENETIATLYNQVGFYLQAIGQYEEAEPFYLKALAISENVLGENHPSTATSYNNLASLYESQGKYEDAEPFYLKALDIREKVLGENHPDTASSYNNLALLYKSQGKYEDAEPFYLKALAISENVLGENHPDTAGSYHNLGAFYFERGKVQDALKLCEKALVIWQNTLPAGHPNIKLAEGWVEDIKNSMS